MREGREEEGETKNTDIAMHFYARVQCYVVLLFAVTIPLPCQKLRVEIIKGRGNAA